MARSSISLCISAPRSILSHRTTPSRTSSTLRSPSQNRPLDSHASVCTRRSGTRTSTLCVRKCGRSRTRNGRRISRGTLFLTSSAFVLLFRRLCWPRVRRACEFDHEQKRVTSNDLSVVTLVFSSRRKKKSKCTPQKLFAVELARRVFVLHGKRERQKERGRKHAV